MGVVSAESPSIATIETDYSTSFFPDATFGEATSRAHRRRSNDDQQAMLERIERILRFAQKRLKKSRVEGFYERKKKKHGSSDGGVVHVQHSDVRLDQVLGNGSYNVVYSVKRIKGSLLNRDDIVVKTLRSKLLADPPMLAACAADLRKEGLLLASLQQASKPHKSSGASNIVQCLAWAPTGLSAYANGCHDSFFLILEKLDRTLTDTLKEWKLLENAAEDEKHRESLRKGCVAGKHGGLKTSSRSILLSSVKNTFFSRDNSQRSYSERSNSLSHSELSEIDQSTNSSSSSSFSNHSSSTGHNSNINNNNCDQEQIRFWKLRLDLLKDLCGAVAFLHSQRIIHRDLKPDNVGFDKKGTLKVFDFDVSRILPNQANWGDYRNETFKMTRKVGSPRYMSPEVAKGEHYNEKADVYALALLAYEILTLKRPFDSLSSKDRGGKGGNVYKDCVQVVVRGNEQQEEEQDGRSGGRKQKRRNSFGNFVMRRNSLNNSTTHSTNTNADQSAGSGKIGSMFRRRSHSRGSTKQSSKTRNSKYANIRPLLPIATPQELTAASDHPQHRKGSNSDGMQARQPVVRSNSFTNRNSSLKSVGSSVRSHHHSVNDINIETGSFFWTRSLRTTIDQAWSYDIPTRPFAYEFTELIGEELERIELSEDLSSCN